jgi:hypothetical protein
MRAMASRVRFRAAGRDRVEHLEVEGSEWAVGAGAEAAVRLAWGPPVAAEVLVRRGQYILRPAGPAAVTVEGAPVRAPRVLAPEEAFVVGALSLSLAPVAGPPVQDLAALLGPFERELAWPGPGRRFALRAGGEAGWAPGEGAAPVGAAGPGLAEARAVPGLGGAGWLEALPPGVRLAELLARLEYGDVGLPPEVAVALIGQLSLALATLHAAFGPHGALTPGFIHLGAQGQVFVVRPPPGARAEEPWLSPEGRFGAGPSVADDAFALASLGVKLLLATGAPAEALAPLTPLLQSDPERRATDLEAATWALRRRVEGAGLDATAAHLARPVRLLLAERSKPLLSWGQGATPER